MAVTIISDFLRVPSVRSLTRKSKLHICVCVVTFFLIFTLLWYTEDENTRFKHFLARSKEKTRSGTNLKRIPSNMGVLSDSQALLKDESGNDTHTEIGNISPTYQDYPTEVPQQSFKQLHKTVEHQPNKQSEASQHALQTNTPPRLSTVQHTHPSPDTSVKSNKVVLLYTTLFSAARWPNLNDEQIKDYPERARCPHAENCKLTYDKESIDYAHAVVFHGVDLLIRKEFNLTHLMQANLRRPSFQRWIFFIHESPVNYPKFDQHKGLFNWTMTYHRKSDIYLPYFMHATLTHEEINQVEMGKNYAKGKNKLVLWMVSHCGVFRDNYVKALQKWIKLSVFGACAANFGGNVTGCKIGTKECLSTIREHKFYLAFENSFCEDYITEKYWNCLLEYETVPIVFGANYDKSVAVPGSYIDSGEFSSIKSLVDYLLYLDKNDTAYNEYFKWKSQYKLFGRDKICYICEKIHRNDLPVKAYDKVWSKEELCDPYNTKQDMYRKQIKEVIGNYSETGK